MDLRIHGIESATIYKHLANICMELGLCFIDSSSKIPLYSTKIHRFLNNFKISWNS